MTEPCALWSTQPLKMSTRDFSWGKGSRCVRTTTYHPRSAERQENPGLNLPGTPWATSAWCGRPLSLPITGRARTVFFVLYSSTVYCLSLKSIQAAIRDKRLTVQTLPEKVSRFQHITKLIDDIATLGKTKRKKKRKKRVKKGRLIDEDTRTHIRRHSSDISACRLRNLLHEKHTNDASRNTTLMAC